MEQSPKGGGGSEIQSILKSLKFGKGKWKLDNFIIDNQCFSFYRWCFQVYFFP